MTTAGWMPSSSAGRDWPPARVTTIPRWPAANRRRGCIAIGGDGTFADVTERSGLGRTAWASSICAGDYDNDGAVDVHVTAFGTNRLYRNRGDGRFEDRSAAAGLPVTGTRWGSGCSFFDYDRDGDLDLFVANYLAFDLATATEPGQGVNCLWKGIPVNCGPKGLPTDTNLLYRNLGDGRFADVSEASGIARVRNRYPMSVVAADLDEDGWVDLYVASDSTAAIQYRNNQDGTFSDVAVARGTAFSENGMAQAGMGAAAGDIDADGRLDLFKTHFADDIPALFRALGGGRFEEVAMAAGLGGQNRYVEWGAGIVDLDNDGWQDLLYVTGNVYPEVERQMPDYPHKSPRIVFRNRGGGSFEDVSAASGPGATTPRSSRGAAFGDFDNDGDQDVLVMNMNEPPSLLRNDLGGGNGWLQVRARGHRVEPDGAWRDGARDRRRANAGARGPEPVELLLPRRSARAVRARRGDRGRAHRGAVAERPAGSRDERAGQPAREDSRGSGAGLTTAAGADASSTNRKIP